MHRVSEFVENYRATWEAVMTDAAGIDELTPFFHIPCLMLSVDGELTAYDSADAIRAFNTSRYDAFKAGGATKATLRGVDVQTMGPYLSAATVNWELLRSDGSIERAWRHYYTVRRTPGALSILVSTFQTGS